MKFRDEYLNVVSSYPLIIRDQLNCIFKTVLEVVEPENLRSLVLIGSAARNELTIEHKPDSIIVHSDYEFIIVIDRAPPTLLKSLSVCMSELEREFQNSSPLFSIDYGVIPYQKLFVTPRTLWSFELANKGVCVWGEDIRDCLPSVTSRNIDLGNLMWLAPVRLWSFTKNMPVDCYRGEPSRESVLVKYILLARNLLDVVTILLPHKGIMIAGYKERQAAFENFPLVSLGKLGCRRQLLREMLEFKLSPFLKENSSELNPSLLVLIYAELFQKIDSNLSWDYDPASLPAFIDKLKKRNIFRHSFLKEVRWLANSFHYCLKNPFKLSLIDRFYWFLGKARYDFFGFLIAFHMAKYYAEEDQRNNEFLDSARSFFARASGKHPKESNSKCYDSSLIALREMSLIFMKNWYESNRN